MLWVGRGSARAATLDADLLRKGGWVIFVRQTPNESVHKRVPKQTAFHESGECDGLFKVERLSWNVDGKCRHAARAEPRPQKSPADAILQANAVPRRH
jgi:hypothetical protein